METDENIVTNISNVKYLRITVCMCVSHYHSFGNTVMCFFLVVISLFLLVCSSGSSELSYEERAAQRKADRERRRREREALAK